MHKFGQWIGFGDVSTPPPLQERLLGRISPQLTGYHADGEGATLSEIGSEGGDVYFDEPQIGGDRRRQIAASKPFSRNHPPIISTVESEFDRPTT